MADTTKILVLNAAEDGEKDSCNSTQASGSEISQKLQKSMLRMTGKFLKEATGTVDYTALRQSEEFREYVSLANCLRSVDVSSLSEIERLAFFINVYNALTVHSICKIQTTTDIATTLDVPNFWGSHAYKVGGFIFTLDDIEHGVLRGNRSHPSTGKPVMAEDDSRIQYSFQRPDPRIHFALNCGAKSCPMVRVYNSENLECGLQAAARSYLSQEVHVEDKGLKIPQIMQWYLEDFAKTEAGMLRWIEPFAEESVRQAIHSQLSNNKENGIHYFYDWSLNKAS